MLYPHNTRVKDALHRSMTRAYLPRRLIRSMVMVSGGLDSVSLLASLLAHTDHEVHAHHIENRNREGRADVENQVLESSLAYLRAHYRPFIYSTSKYELLMGLGGGLDMTLTMFMAARVIAAEGQFMDLVFTGHVASAVWDYNEASAVFTACYTNRRDKPLWLVPLEHMSKLDIYNAIPPELADLTWSCRTPQLEGTTYVPCRKCHACDTRAHLSAEVAAFKAKAGAA